jgi:hypothetical protein
MAIQMDEVLWEFSKCYRKKFLAEYLDAELNADNAALALMLALETNGDAVQNISPDGNVTWTATTKFLGSTGLERGPLVTSRSTLN